MNEPRSPLTVVIANWQTIDAFHKALTTPANYRIARTSRDEDVAPLLRGADALISARFSPGLVEAADSLRLIQTPGAGTNEIDFSAVPAQTTVCNVYGHERGIAEYVFTTMSMLGRDFPGMDRRLRTGDWRDYLDMPRSELRGKTVVIVGFGHIGQEVARWAAFVSMRVIAVTRTAVSFTSVEVEQRVAIDQLNAVLPEADYVVLALPLNAETAGMFGAAQLAAMKPSAFLINVARGGVTDEAALYAALAEQTIAGAAIDVWYRYPVDEHPTMPSMFPFHELSNVIMTPHIAGATENTFRYRWSVIDENLRCLRDGTPLSNVVSGPR